ncbi:MAG TPA: hypothetical protein VGI92_09685 [Gemmatimonadales bacterium]
MVWLVITLVTWWMLASRHVAPLTYLIIAPLSAVAALYFFEVKEKTCVLLAPVGLKEKEEGGRGRLEQEWISIVQRQARKVWIETLATTAIVTGLALALASWRS